MLKIITETDRVISGRSQLDIPHPSLAAMLDLVIYFAVGGLLFCLLCFAAASVRIVDTGYVRVIARFGKIHRVLHPGKSFVIPLIDRTVKMRWMLPVSPNQRDGDRIFRHFSSVPTREVRHDPGPYQVMLRDLQIKFVDLNFFTQIKTVEKARNSDNIWKNIEDHVEVAVVNLCRNYDSENTIIQRLQSDLMKHEDIKRFCEQYGINLVSVQIQRVSSTDETIKLREKSASNVLRSRAAKLETDAELEAKEHQLNAEKKFSEKQHQVTLFALANEANLELARLEAEISKEKTSRSLAVEKCRTNVERAQSDSTVTSTIEAGRHSVHFKNMENLPPEHRSQVLQAYYYAQALQENTSVKTITMCSHLPYGSSFYHPQQPPTAK